MSTTPSDDVLIAFIIADLAKKRAMLEVHPEIVGNEAAARLEFVASAQAGQEIAQYASDAAAFIRDCMARGADAVFAHAEAVLRAYHESRNSDQLLALLTRIEAIQIDPEAAGDQLALCEEALPLVHKGDRPGLWAALHAIRGNARQKLGNRAADPVVLREAVADFAVAIAIFSREQYPLDWARSQVNRAIALDHLGSLAGEPEVLREAIAGFDAALDELSSNNSPLDLGRALLGRAVAYKSLGERSGSPDLFRDAVVGCDQAMEIFTRDTHPAEWSMIMSNRGTALECLGHYSGNPAILRESLADHEAAIDAVTREADPVRWGGAQQNRAGALRCLGELLSEPAFFLEAIRGYDAALEALATTDDKTAWARILVDRGTALLSLGELAENPDVLNDAVASFDRVFDLFSRETSPTYWTRAQMNRANAIARRGEILMDQADLLEAVRRFEALLETTPPGQSAAEWARIHSNRAGVLRNLALLTKDPAHSDEALAGFRRALEALTMDAHPDDCMAASSAMVRMLFERGEFEEARGRLDLVLSGGLEHLLGLADPGARERAVEQAAGLAELRAWIAIVVDRDANGALLWLERSRGQLLAMSLAADPKNAFGVGPTEVEALLGAVRDGGAAVLPIITPNGARVAVIPACRERLEEDDFLDLPELSRERVQSWFYGSRGDPELGGYLGAYRRGRLNWSDGSGSEGLGIDQSFPEAVRVTLGEVWRHLLGPVDARLCDLGLSPGASVVIIPSGLLSLLPLWAAAEDLRERVHAEPFGARWTVSQAPSLGIFRVVRDRDAAWRARGSPVSALAVLDPETIGVARLPGAALEGRVLKARFGADRYRSLSDSKGTREAVEAALPGVTHLHLSAHGFYSADRPGLSAILLAGDDRLSLNDLRNMNVTPDLRLVLLSACDTALPGLQPGRTDEFIGLPAGFVQAGAAAVIASHWPVRDDATFFLMWKFYDEYLDDAGCPRQGADSALRSASLWLRDVTWADLASLFEPVYDPDGALIPNGIDRGRPRRRPQADISTETSTASSGPTVAEFRLPTPARRHDTVNSDRSAAARRQAIQRNGAAYFFPVQDPGELSRKPFHSPMFWAAFSMTGT